MKHFYVWILLVAALTAAFEASGRERVRSLEDATEAVVLHVAPSDIDPPRRGYERGRGAEMVGALLGAGLAYQTTRNRSSGTRASALAAGTALGAAAGNRYAERRRYGFDVLLELRTDYGRTRTVSLFVESDPQVLPGDRVYLVGRDRIIRVPVVRDERL